jgi:hypothetical protein
MCREEPILDDVGTTVSLTSAVTQRWIYKNLECIYPEGQHDKGAVRMGMHNRWFCAFPAVNSSFTSSSRYADNLPIVPQTSI